MPDDAVLYNDDCRNVLPTLAPDSVDLILTDPPYGVGFQSHRPPEDFRKPELMNDRPADTLPMMLQVLPMLYRVLRPGGIAAFFGGFQANPELLIRALEIGFLRDNRLVWDKMDPGLGFTYRYQWEEILLYHKPPRRVTWNGGTTTSNILRYPVRGALFAWQLCHPTPKPLNLMSQLVRDNTNVGGLVLDPFCGTGSALVAALRCQRRALGVELDPAYHAEARSWVDATLKQGDLFKDVVEGLDRPASL